VHTSDYLAIGVVAVLALVIQLIQFRVRRAMERSSGAPDPDRNPSKPRHQERIVVKNEKTQEG